MTFSALNIAYTSAGGAEQINMKSVLLNEGSGRTKVGLCAQKIGEDYVVYLFNDKGHIGAVAIADYHEPSGRACTSVITRLGHKDDAPALRSAHKLCKHFKAPVCVIAGIHVQGISRREITQIMRNCDRLTDRFIEVSKHPGRTDSDPQGRK